MARLVNSLTLPEQASPSTPASGGLTVFAKPDGLLYSKNDSGLETVLVTSATAQTLVAPKTFAASTVADVPITVKGFLGQTSDLTQWQSSTGTVLAAVTNVGIFSSRAGWFAATAATDLTLYVSGFTSQSTALATFKAGASASGNFAEWQNSSSTVLARITSSGAIYATGVYDTNSRVYSSNNTVPVSGITASGTPNNTTFLRGDGSWQVVTSGAVSSKTVTLASGNYYFTEPSPTSFVQTQFVASDTKMDIRIEVSGRGWGLTMGSLAMHVCNSTLSRRPAPRTQTEYLSGVAGITNYPLGLIGAGTEWQAFASSVGTGTQSTVSKTVQLTGLTAGNTYNVDVTTAIAGAADTFNSPVTAATYASPFDIVPTNDGTIKVFAGSQGTSPTNILVSEYSATWPYNPIKSVASIPVSSGIYAIAKTPDNKKIVALAYIDATHFDFIVINAVTYAVISTTRQNLSLVNYTLAISPDSTTAWVATASTIVPIGIATGTQGTAITGAAAGIIKLAISSDGVQIHALANNGNLSGIYTYNISTRAANGVPITMPNNPSTPSPTAFAITKDNSLAYIADSGNYKIVEVNLNTRITNRNISTGNTSGGYSSVQIMPGDQTRSILIFCNGTSAVEGQCTELHVADWSIYTSWGTITPSGGVSDGKVGDRGEIFMLDYTHNQMNYFYGGRVAIDNTSAQTYLHPGESLRLIATPAT